MLKRVATAIVVASVALSAGVSAQTPPPGGTPAQQQPATPAPQDTQPPADYLQSMPVETRKATTTFRGDTGLWFVPTGEVLPARKWSFSAYRVNFDYNEGFTDVSNWPITFGFGLGDRAELFGAWDVVRRIDRDSRPIFFSTNQQGGVVANEYPFVRQGWSGNQLGDLWIGGKVNLMSQWRQSPAAFALRGLVKLPTAKDDEEGVGTGKPDFAIDAVLSKEFNERVELSGFGGMIFRGKPDQVEITNGFRWGVGAGFPTRRNLRLTAELHGETYLDDSLTLTSPLIGDDGSISPLTANLDSPFNASVGLTWIGDSGVFAGAGLNWRVRLDGRGEFGPYEDETGDSLGFQVRIGYHPGVRVYVPPPPPPPPAPPPAQNRPPVVDARCEPCTVEVGRTATVTADASDPDGDTLTYKWSAPAGTITNPNARQTPWTAPMQEGPVQFTVQVDDGKGGTASDNVTIQVIRPAVKEFVFEDVHFDFDRYSLRPEATRALDEAIKTMQSNAELRLEIEGHTCNIGTAEYNLALGERRAAAVREYLAGRGIGPDRLRTVSYGEERPKHDNAREETRRLNRRAALVVRLQR
ncbi:MAG TPA: OmpA family protein [Vicinamibacterales bacterium]|jgi:outer membrane protein OmpA-like peptidoglycan-associated protein|nr:OmpA family protein [Vicinamibacterales bacterium]